MPQLLDKAVEEVRKLSDEDQEAFAAWILAEIEDEKRWDQSFSKSTNKLQELIARAKQQVRDGQCRSTGFDDL